MNGSQVHTSLFSISKAWRHFCQILTVFKGLYTQSMLATSIFFQAAVRGDTSWADLQTHQPRVPQSDLEAVIDSTGVSGVNQGFGVADFHQGRRVNVLLLVRGGRGPPQHLGLLPVIKPVQVTGAPQVQLHFLQVFSPHHGAHPSVWREWRCGESVCHWRPAGAPQLATRSGYIGKVVVPWMVFADGRSSGDYLPVLWECSKGWAGYKYTQCGHKSLYHDTHWWGVNHSGTEAAQKWKI